MTRIPSLGLAVPLIVLLSACDNSMMIEGCEPSVGIEVFCGLNKPEDLEPLGNHPWMLVVELGDFRAIPPAAGSLGVLNLRDDSYVRLEPTVAATDPSSAFPRCGSPPKDLRPRGFHVSDLDDGGFRLLVVNAPGETRIERYRLEVDADDPTNPPRVAWEGCVSVPGTVFPNDVAALSSDGFVVSHMFDPPRDQFMSVKFFLGLDTGYAAAWSPETGWTKVEGTDTAFPNGVEADPETDRVFVASTYGQQFIAADAFGDNARSVRIPVQSDNITWMPDGRLLAVGHAGVPLLGIQGCREAVGLSHCSFPFAAVAIDPETFEQEIIFEHTEGLIPGASVALSHNGYLYMGTVFGDRISRVSLND